MSGSLEWLDRPTQAGWYVLEDFPTNGRYWLEEQPVTLTAGGRLYESTRWVLRVDGECFPVTSRVRPATGSEPLGTAR